ncbi:hypothetical protein GGR56DRAFT_622425 [Xylariaceae sp. FL0804]|nr:hypothetical protein GGR56DRAFT_622425 [Xylariaceae sp. FL0804]
MSSGQVPLYNLCVVLIISTCPSLSRPHLSRIGDGRVMIIVYRELDTPSGEIQSDGVVELPYQHIHISQNTVILYGKLHVMPILGEQQERCSLRTKATPVVILREAPCCYR